MKKSILILCWVITTFGLMAFGYLNWSNTETAPEEKSCTRTKADIELFYDVDSRYVRTVTKEQLNMAESFLDIVPEDPRRSIVSYSSVKVTNLDENISESGVSPFLNAAQIKLLRSVPYSTNILIRAEYLEKNMDTGILESNYTTPYITVVPEKQAVSMSGKEALVNYVRENTDEFRTIVKEDELQPGKVTFAVNEAGKVMHATLTSTSGYPAFDQKMIDLVSGMPGSWEPAKNSKGEKVIQKFVFSFGIIGC